MDHKESDSVKVYFSSNHAMFRMIMGNRELNEGKIKRIIADMDAGIDVLKYYPIQVREVGDILEIIDGQHRFYIARKKGRPVYYIIMKEDRSISDIAKINSNVEKWKTKDFIKAYVSMEKDDYKELDEFMRKYSLSATLAIALLENKEATYGMGGNDAHNRFQRGEFKATYKLEATKLADACAHFKDFKHWKDSRFFTAVQKIMEQGKVDIYDIVKKFGDYKDELVKQLSWKDYITNLETIYNKKLRSRVIIWE